MSNIKVYSEWLNEQKLVESFDHDTFCKYYKRALASLEELKKYLEDHKKFADKDEEATKDLSYEPYLDCYNIKDIAASLESLAERIGKSVASRERSEKNKKTDTVRGYY